MKFLFLLFSLISLAQAKEPIKVAIIDSGLDLDDPRFSTHICPKGHHDFTGFGIEDTDSHGTHVAGIIKQNAGDGNYCFLIYKYYDRTITGYMAMKNEVNAIKEAISNKADIVNISGGGDSFSEDEYILIYDNPEIKFVVSAGNENKNIDLPTGYFFPATIKLPNIIPVGNINDDGSKALTSDWANRQIAWEKGMYVLSTTPNGGYGEKSGTSMSCAVHTGKLVRKMLNARR